jgi:hypothetical protein
MCRQAKKSRCTRRKAQLIAVVEKLKKRLEVVIAVWPPACDMKKKI